MYPALTPAELEQVRAEWRAFTASPKMRVSVGNWLATIDALVAERDALGQFLAHTHMHLTNDDNFCADEFEVDLRALNGGIWIDTETLLAAERLENDRLRKLLAKG